MNGDEQQTGRNDPKPASTEPNPPRSAAATERPGSLPDQRRGAMPERRGQSREQRCDPGQQSSARPGASRSDPHPPLTARPQPPSPSPAASIPDPSRTAAAPERLPAASRPKRRHRARGRVDGTAAASHRDSEHINKGPQHVTCTRPRPQTRAHFPACFAAEPGVPSIHPDTPYMSPGGGRPPPSDTHRREEVFLTARSYFSHQSVGYSSFGFFFFFYQFQFVG